MASLAAIGVVDDPVGVGVEARQETGADGRAEGRGGERVEEPRSFAGQAVDLGCLHEWVAGAADLVPTEIVDEDHDDVGTFGGFGAVE
jgi:hypothetical protein